MTDEPLLSARGLVKEFVSSRGFFQPPVVVRAVSDISLDVARGESVAIVGESGCGKSTLGRMLLRLTDPTRGQIVLDGVDLTTLTHREMRYHRRKIQLVFQDPYASLNPLMTIGQILREPIMLHGIVPPGEIDARVREVLELVGLKPSDVSAYPHEFSGGQRQRIAIGRALAVEPMLVVCDEPVSALDVSVRAQILNLLKDIQKELGVASIFISHDLSAVRYVANRVVVMYLGSMVEQGPCEALFAEPRHPYTRALLSSVPSARVKARAGPVLKGDVPSPLNLPSGCHFHRRCPYAQDLCRAVKPEPVDDGSGHTVACHFWQTLPEWESGAPAEDDRNPYLSRLIQSFNSNQGERKERT